MTLSREQAILAECLARLTGAPLGPVDPPEGLGVDRSRMRELAPEKLPWMSLYPIESPRSERNGSAVKAWLSVKLVLWVRGRATVPVDEDLDPLWLWAHQQLFTDESLGGLVISLTPTSRTWGFALHQAPFGDLDLHFDICYRHQAADPSRPA